MVREGSVVPAMSDASQRDRLRTRAISLFLVDHREELLCKLDRPGLMDRFTRRNALMRVARKKFKEVTDSWQSHYTNLASALVGKKKGSGASGEKGKKECSSGSGEKRCETQVAEQDQRTEVHDGPQSSSAEMSLQTPVAKRRRRESSEIQRLTLPNMWRSTLGETREKTVSPSVSKAALRRELVDCAGCSRKIYGEAGSYETLAGGLCILDKVSVATWTGDDTP